MALTLVGAEQNDEALQHLKKFPPQELSDRVVRLMAGDRFNLVKVPIGISGMGMDMVSPSTEVEFLLENLSTDHPIVRELLKQISTNLSEIATIDSNDTRLQYHDGGDREDMYMDRSPYCNSIWSCARVHSEWGYEHIKRAALFRAEHPVYTKEQPPKEARIMSDLAGVFIGYRDEHPTDIREYTDLLYDRKLSLPFVIQSYLKAGDKRALDLFIDIIAASGGKNEFVFHGVKRTMPLGYFGRFILDRMPQYDFLGQMPEVLREDILSRGQK